VTLGDRKALRAALFDRLSTTVQGIAFFSPEFMDFEQVKQKPALTLAMDSEVPTNRPGLPTVWELNLVATLHVSTRNGTDSVDDVISDLLDQVEASLLRQANELSQYAHTTLGGLVTAAYISGEIAYLSAGRGGQTVVDIPITIETLVGSST
jgi:hypothetical protein